LRVLIICYVHPPEVAPAGVMVRDLAEDLAAGGHDVTVLTGWPNHPRGKLFAGFRARWRHTERDGRHRLVRVAHGICSKASALGRLWVYFTFAVSSFLNGLVLGRQDVVVSLSTPLLGVWTAWALARLWRGRFVNVIFDLWPEVIRNAGLVRAANPLYRLTRWVDTRNCLWSDRITTLGEGMRDQIAERGIAPERIEVIPFWIDTDRIRPLPRDNAWRRQQGIAPEIFVALFAGTIGYASGAQMLVRTADALAGRGDILLLIVGEGVVKDELERLAAAQGARNLKFLPFQPADRLAEMQSAADVGLVTLLPQAGSSSVPSKVLGYMAAGRAVIASATDDTDTARLIRQAECGLAVAAQDGAALAEAIVSLADDRPHAEDFGRHARQYAVEHFSRGVVIGKYRQVILGQTPAGCHRL
jgi:colanic acid biosynthesis glycosyl transferase WcaI